MRFSSWGRGLAAAALLGLVCYWTAARVAVFQIRNWAEDSFWRGRIGEALEHYENLRDFGWSAADGLTGMREVYLAALESSAFRTGPLRIAPGEITRRCGKAVRRQVEEAPLAADTWAGLADLMSVLKPENQGRRIYRLEELAGPPEARLEIEDLLQIRALEVSVALDPNAVYYRDTLADLAWGLGLREFAKRHYGEVVTILPDPTRHLFLAPGRVTEELGEVVVEGFERAVKPPRSAEREMVYRHLGIFLLGQERFEEASGAFQQAQKASGRSYASWRAYAAIHLGRVDEAIALYREALSQKSMETQDRFHVLLNLGSLLEQQGRHREAAEDLRSALLLKPREPRALLLLGQVYESMQLWQDAEEHYVRASEIGSDRISTLVNLVAFYRRIGRPGLALVPAQELVKLQPDEPLYRKQIEDIQADFESKGP